MKKVSARMFFSVLWKGITQTFGWFFSLFGYKRDGKFAKCVWGLFALSGTVFMACLSIAVVNSLYRELNYCYGHTDYCYWDSWVSGTVFVHNHGDGKAWVKNSLTGKKTLKNIYWYVEPIGKQDSLVVFSDGKKRGYFNKNTGEVEIPAIYDKAWIFSDGIAGVLENGVVKFIDQKGNQVIERTFTNTDADYVFHGGFCVVDSDSDHKVGLIDENGTTVFPEEYDKIVYHSAVGFWTVSNDGECGVIDHALNPVLPLMDCSIVLTTDGIDVTMADNTIRKYDLQGNMLDDFYITDFEYLEYALEETYQYETQEYENYEYHPVIHFEYKQARARFAKYTAGNAMNGLMTLDGHMVTLPKYEDIIAVGPDTYLCTVSHGHKEIVNGKGEKVR